MKGRECDKYLERIVEQWASTTPSLCRVYLAFGYDDLAHIHDGGDCVGCRFRMMKLPTGTWKSVNIQYWHPENRTFSPHLYCPYDDLPGILEEDADFFHEDF